MIQHPAKQPVEPKMSVKEDDSPKVVFDKQELRDRLTHTQYLVTQEHHTEKQFTNEFYKHNSPGMYSCVVCGIDQFSSRTKYNSGSGWPSFWDVVDKTNIRCRSDASAVGGNLLRIVADPGLIRTEVSCKTCGGHLGHVFKDGPKPTGLRYCVNSASLQFKAAAVASDDTEPPASTDLISHPATLGGCGGVDGVCQRVTKIRLSPAPQPAIAGQSVK